MSITACWRASAGASDPTMRTLVLTVGLLLTLFGACQAPHSATPSFASQTSLRLILYG